MALTQEQLRNFKSTYKAPGGPKYIKHKEERNTCYGVIYPSDFNGYTSLTYMGRKIYSNWCFDKSCVVNDNLRSGVLEENVYASSISNRGRN